MGSHPINLTIRFLLEITALISIGNWAWQQGAGGLRYLFAIGAPLILALVWATFNVPHDPSRSGSAPVVVPGIIRLLIELGVFALAYSCLQFMGMTSYSHAFGILVLLHYAASYDRIIGLLTPSRR